MGVRVFPESNPSDIRGFARQRTRQGADGNPNTSAMTSPPTATSTVDCDGWNWCWDEAGLCCRLSGQWKRVHDLGQSHVRMPKSAADMLPPRAESGRVITRWIRCAMPLRLQMSQMTGKANNSRPKKNSVGREATVKPPASTTWSLTRWPLSKSLNLMLKPRRKKSFLFVIALSTQKEFRFIVLRIRTTSLLLSSRPVAFPSASHQHKTWGGSQLVDLDAATHQSSSSPPNKSNFR